MRKDRKKLDNSEVASRHVDAVREEGEIGDYSDSLSSRSKSKSPSSGSERSESPGRRSYKENRRRRSTDRKRRHSSSERDDKDYLEGKDRVRSKKERKRRRSQSKSKPVARKSRSDRSSLNANDSIRKLQKRTTTNDAHHRENGSQKNVSSSINTTLKHAEPLDARSAQRALEIARLINEDARHDEKEVDMDPVWSLKKAQIEKPSRQCPYLDTIDRSSLDFDFEKLCSVSLSHVNVYACMVCGKYFQGRGTSTHAYTHSLDTNHRVFLNLQTLKFYCLPDNYEIIDPSLEDIKYVLKPTYAEDYIKTIDTASKMSRALDGSVYHPGVVGLNNIKANDYENVVLHALSHVSPLRNYFLREENYGEIRRPPGDKLALLPKRFGELIRKLWNPRSFKAHVSPHEMLQASVLCSDKKFQITKQGDAYEFLNFLLNTLHIALNGTKKTSSSIVYKIFRGRMNEYARKVVPVETSEEKKKELLATEEYQEKKKETPFLYLSLDLPAAPLYRDELMQNIIPQVPLSALLSKFNGIVEKEYKTYRENFMKRFELVRLPLYLIIMYRRFHKNQWFIEKNPTIVNFPISNVDLYDCIAKSQRDNHKYTTYDLVANIVHDGPQENGSYRVQILHNGTQKWYELEDLHVKEILPQMITLAESYIQIWRLNLSKTREQRAGETDEDMPMAQNLSSEQRMEH